MKSFHDGSCRTGLALVCVLLLGYNLINIDDLHISRIDLSSARALCAMINGSVEDYDQAYRQRIELLNTPSEICYLPSLTECPPFRSDLVAEDPGYWVNYGMAQYYQHEKIVLRRDDLP